MMLLLFDVEKSDRHERPPGILEENDEEGHSSDVAPRAIRDRVSPVSRDLTAPASGFTRRRGCRPHALLPPGSSASA